MKPGKVETSVKIMQSCREKVTNVCCAVALLLIIPILIMNVMLIVQIYVLKEEVPTVGGYFPLISLEDEASIDIEKGDLILCRKFDEDTSLADEWKAGKAVTHFADDSHTSMCIATFLSVDDDQITLLSPKDEKPYELAVDDIIGEYCFSIPMLGQVIYFLSTIPGFLICVVIPTIVLTEIYLYFRRKDAMSAEDEESMLLAELAALKAEREQLLKQPPNSPTPKINKRRKREAIHSRRGVWAHAKRKAKAKRQKR